MVNKSINIITCSKIMALVVSMKIGNCLDMTLILGRDTPFVFRFWTTSYNQNIIYGVQSAALLTCKTRLK